MNKLTILIIIALIVLACPVLLLHAGSIETHVLITDFYGHRVMDVDRTDTTDSPSGTVVWQYGNVNNLYATPPGAGHGIGPNQLFKVHNAKPLPNGNVLIADWGNHRVIEVDRNKNVIWQYGTSGVYGTGPNYMRYPEAAYVISNGNTLISDVYNKRVIEIDRANHTAHPNGTIVYQYGHTNVPGTGPNYTNYPPPDAEEIISEAPPPVVGRYVYYNNSAFDGYAVVANTADDGAIEPDVFYFGNAIGETGNSATEAKVTPTGHVGVRNNPHTLAHDPADIDDAYDFNRDQKVGPTDELEARNNGTNASTALQLISAP